MWAQRQMIYREKSDWIVAPFSNHKWTDLKKICVQYLVSTGRN